MLLVRKLRLVQFCVRLKAGFSVFGPLNDSALFLPSLEEYSNAHDRYYNFKKEAFFMLIQY